MAFFLLTGQHGLIPHPLPKYKQFSGEAAALKQGHRMWHPAQQQLLLGALLVLHQQGYMG